MRTAHFPYGTEHPKSKTKNPIVIINTLQQTPPSRTRGSEARQSFVTDMPIDTKTTRLTTETVQGAALALQGVDDVERGDSLALCVLGVCDGITDDTLEEGLEDGARLLVDHGRDTLDTTTTSETSDGGLGDTLDVVTKNLAVTLGTALAEALAALSASSHVDGWLLGKKCGGKVRLKMCSVCWIEVVSAKDGGRFEVNVGKRSWL
jgi:hypothetical protein